MSKQSDRAAKAQAAQAAQAAAERRRTIRSVTIVVFGLVLIIVVGFLLARQMDSSTDVSAAEAGTGEYGVVIGDPAAPHTVVVYEDFLCPFCGDLEAATREDFERLAEAGDLLVEYRPFNLLERISDYSPRSTNAFAVVLEESGPEVAKTFHDLLFENQPPESGPFPDDEALLDLAVEAGASESDVSDGILNEGQADWVEGATQAAADAGVRGTPTVILDGAVIQGSPDDILDAVLSAVGE